MHRDHGAEVVYFGLCSPHRVLQMRWWRPEVTFLFWIAAAAHVSATCDT